ncbi:MAG: UDP-N-acetylmuramoyl-L-alanine--D-glutamate ligase [Firmicutes bacterium]|nr:UDP-N-acetylmuramoyl-L-alanine--D-glutamate ligase [Bacillota bacterium]
MAARAPAKRVFFSRSPLEQGVFVEDGMIVISDEKEKRPIISTTDILIPGQHNVENYLAAIAAVEGLVSREVIEKTAKTFPGVEHRIELVRTLGGVRYYNDSIASSPTRTIAGLRSFDQKLILIAGGYDKKIPFDVLGEEICRRVKSVILTGHTAEKIRESILAAPNYTEDTPEIMMADSFQEAVLAAYRKAQPGDVVILSPACASFDHFPNFAERGRTFKTIVNNLP